MMKLFYKEMIIISNLFWKESPVSGVKLSFPVKVWNWNFMNCMKEDEEKQ